MKKVLFSQPDYYQVGVWSKAQQKYLISTKKYAYCNDKLNMTFQNHNQNCDIFLDTYKYTSISLKTMQTQILYHRYAVSLIKVQKWSLRNTSFIYSNGLTCIQSCKMINKNCMGYDYKFTPSSECALQTCFPLS